MATNKSREMMTSPGGSGESNSGGWVGGPAILIYSEWSLTTVQEMMSTGGSGGQTDGWVGGIGG